MMKPKKCITWYYNVSTENIICAMYKSYNYSFGDLGGSGVSEWICYAFSLVEVLCSTRFGLKHNMIVQLDKGRVKKKACFRNL